MLTHNLFVFCSSTLDLVVGTMGWVGSTLVCDEVGVACSVIRESNDLLGMMPECILTMPSFLGVCDDNEAGVYLDEALLF